MKIKAVSGMMLTLLLIGMLTLAFNVQRVKAEPGTIVIEADGSVNPPSANITSSDNITYTFTDNNYDNIVVHRNNIIIDGNGSTLEGSGSGNGFELVGISNVTIKNTNIKSFSFGVYLGLSSNNTVSGNNITNNTSCGVVLDSSSNNTVSGNNVTNNTSCGVRLDWSSNNTVSGNNMTNNAYGVYLRLSSNNNTVSGNTITNNTEYGVRLVESSNNNTVSGNNITNNYYYGVDFYWSCNNNTVSGNNITNNTLYGVGLRSSSNNNTVSSNNITNNTYGVYLRLSSNNTFYHNNFINNTQHVYILSPGYANFWNSSYPTGGNYWSNYTGVDLYSGPYPQNDVGSDGIGDTSHVLDAWNRDNYPYINRDGWGCSVIQIPDPTGGQKNLTITTNATITHVVATKNGLKFWATGEPEETYYINATIPVGLNTTAIRVKLDETWLEPPPWPEITTNSTHYFIYFEFTASTHEITIQYGIASDVNADCSVSVADMVEVDIALGTKPGEPNYNPNADVNGDGNISVADMVVIDIHLGETW